MMTLRHTVVSIKDRRSTDRTALQDRDDDALMRLARGGVPEAFDVLVLRHQRRLLNVAYKSLGSTILARDVVQATFLEVYNYLPRYRPRGKFRAFVHRLLLNQCRMVHRSGHYERRAATLLCAEAEPESELPEAQILEREGRREVEQAVAGLSRKLREVVVLRFVAEMSYGEIAKTLDLPLGTVKSRLFAGLKKLVQQLEEGR